MAGPRRTACTTASRYVAHVRRRLEARRGVELQPLNPSAAVRRLRYSRQTRSGGLGTCDSGLSRQEGANGYYRLLLPLMAMRERGHEVVHVEQEYKRVIDIRPLVGCDYVHLHRPALLYDDGEVVTKLLERGIAVGFDEDDNVVDMPLGLEERTDQPWAPRARRNFELLLEHVAPRPPRHDAERPSRGPLRGGRRAERPRDRQLPAGRVQPRRAAAATTAS